MARHLVLGLLLGACGDDNDLACHFDSDCSGGTPKCCPKMFTPSYKVCAAAC